MDKYRLLEKSRKGRAFLEKARKFFRRWARIIAGLILLACLALTVVYINAERMVEKNKGLNSMCNTVVPVKNGDVLKQTIWLNEEDNHYGSKLTLSPGFSEPLPVLLRER